MDTPIIAQYYREKDPAKRRELLEQAIAQEGNTEENQVRKEVWDARYGMESEVLDDHRVQPCFRKQIIWFQECTKEPSERTGSGKLP